MEKYVDCHNCQNQYDCERTYLGGCTDGKEWENETEKAFVDGWEQRREELKAERQAILEFEKDICKNASPCALVDWVDCDKKADCGKVRNQAKVLYRLGYRKLSEGSVIITKAQKAEIERLTEEKNDLEQRYLEESKERCEFEQKYKKIQHAHNIGLGAQRSHWEKKVQQAVKDTAREILSLRLQNMQKLKAKFENHYTDYMDDDRPHLIALINGEILSIKNLAKEYGVEVEL